VFLPIPIIHLAGHLEYLNKKGKEKRVKEVEYAQSEPGSLAEKPCGSIRKKREQCT
jgi:hypothetical protein